MNELNNKYRMMIESVRNLTLSYKELIRFIPEYCVLEDELLDDFLTSFEFMEELREFEFINDKQFEIFKEIRLYIYENDDILILDDLDNYDNQRIDYLPFWIELKKLSSSALKLLDSRHLKIKIDI